MVIFLCPDGNLDSHFAICLQNGFGPPNAEDRRLGARVPSKSHKLKRKTNPYEPPRTVSWPAAKAATPMFSPSANF